MKALHTLYELAHDFWELIVVSVLVEVGPVVHLELCHGEGNVLYPYEGTFEVSDMRQVVQLGSLEYCMLGDSITLYVAVPQHVLDIEHHISNSVMAYGVLPLCRMTSEWTLPCPLCSKHLHERQVKLVLEDHLPGLIIELKNCISPFILELLHDSLVGFRMLLLPT